MSNFVKFQILICVVLFTACGFWGGYYVGKRGFEVGVKVNPPKVTITNKSPTDKTVDMALFWKVWDRVHNTYLERPVDSQKMMYGAIEGMVKSLGDPYSSFLPPQTNSAVNDSLAGKYEGIGAELAIEDGLLIVVSPLDGSPSKEAGLQPRDVILAIDDFNTSGMSLTEAVSKIRGSAGTVVTLKIFRKGKDTQDIKITRGEIKMDSVTWSDKGDGTAYIRISRFGPDTNENWDKVVAKANVQMSELDAVVIDVRGNPGGYLQSAVHIAGEFFNAKPAVWEETADGKRTPLNTDRVGSFTKIPAVFVLIDGGSASASEILSAALRDTVDAKLIGVKSFGKGTIQDAENYDDDSGLHVTIAKWLTPKQEWIHKKGLEPDVTVELSDEDIKNSKDTQLEKALELAKQY